MTTVGFIMGFILCFLMVALGMDYSVARMAKQTAQDAADAAAMAACQEIELGGDPSGMAAELANLNPSGAGETVVSSVRTGRWNYVTSKLDPGSPFPNAAQVDVIIDAKLPLWTRPIRVHAGATARIGHEPSLVFRGGDLAISGGARLDAPDGTFKVGHGQQCALGIVDSQTILDCSELLVCGVPCIASEACLPGGPIESADEMAADPCADWPEVSPRGMADRGDIVTSGMYLPGRYRIVELTGGTVILRPGQYSFGSFRLHGDARMEASGCSIYLEDQVWTEIDNGASLRADVVFQSRLNGYPFLVGDRASVDIETLYCLSAKLQLSGIGHRRFGLISCGSCTVRDRGQYRFVAKERTKVFLVK